MSINCLLYYLLLYDKIDKEAKQVCFFCFQLEQVFSGGIKMDGITLVVLSGGLAMDAFAGSICKGLALKKIAVKNAVLVGLWFGGFQALMPVIGYLLGLSFQQAIAAIDHWIAVVLLSVIGINMIREAFSHEEEEKSDASLTAKAMFPLAIATSIDALAVGVTFAFLKVNILFAAFSIGIITFLLSSFGVWLGGEVGAKYQSKAEFAGGVVLIIMGIKILLEHLGVLV